MCLDKGSTPFTSTNNLVLFLNPKKNFMRPEVKKKVLIRNPRYKFSWYKVMIKMLRNKGVRNFRKKSMIESI